MTEPGTILLVDDEPDFVEVYVEILGKQGYVVTPAASRDEALAILAADGTRFDVVILDQRLRKGDDDSGLALIAQVQALAPFCKIIVVTGYAAPEAVERAFASGAYDYLEKAGVFEALLVAKVRNAVEVASERRRAARSHAETVRELSRLWQEARSEADRHRKGLLLEELVKLLFGATAGFEHVITRVASDIEEIDIVVENRSLDPLWQKDGAQFVIGECKNWSSHCDRREFDSFYMKMRRRYQRVRTGIFIAPGGFTAAFHEARKREKNGHVVIPVDAADLERWIREDDRAAVLNDLLKRAVFDEQ